MTGWMKGMSRRKVTGKNQMFLSINNLEMAFPTKAGKTMQGMDLEGKTEFALKTHERLPFAFWCLILGSSQHWKK